MSTGTAPDAVLLTFYELRELLLFVCCCRTQRVDCQSTGRPFFAAGKLEAVQRRGVDGGEWLRLSASPCCR